MDEFYHHAQSAATATTRKTFGETTISVLRWNQFRHGETIAPTNVCEHVPPKVLRVVAADWAW